MEKKKLSDNELLKVINMRNICASTPDVRTPITYCTDDALDAEIHAGVFGWWCCNCKDAIEVCGNEEGKRYL